MSEPTEAAMWGRKLLPNYVLTFDARPDQLKLGEMLSSDIAIIVCGQTRVSDLSKLQQTFQTLFPRSTVRPANILLVYLGLSRAFICAFQESD
jgi:hypothetical protein